MALEACICGLTVSRNTGQPACEPIADAEKRAIFVNTVAEDGTENFIDLENDDLSDLAFWTEKINEDDETKRFYFLPKTENVEDLRADALFQSFNGGKNLFIQEAPRTYVAMYPKVSAKYVGQLQKFRCSNTSKYVITKSGQLVGYVRPEFPNRLYPLALDKDTYYAKLEKAVEGSAVQMAMLVYEYDESMIDSQIRLVEPSSLAGNLLSETQFAGLLDVDLAESSTVVPTVTTLTVTASLHFGPAGNPSSAKGLVPADFELINTTTPGAVTVDTVVYDTNTKEYTLTFAAQPNATDGYTLTISKNGFESNTLVGDFQA